MCIQQTTSWAYGGTNYPTELDAVKAALTDLGRRFVQEYHSKPFEGMLALGMEITPLRDRYIALTAPEAQAGEGTSEKAGGDPSDKTLPERRLAVQVKIENIRAGDPLLDRVTEHLADKKWPTFGAFYEYADGQQLHPVETILGLREDDEQRKPPKNRRVDIRNKFSSLESTHPMKRAAVIFMEREGYTEPRAFWTRANASQFDELERILEMAK